MFGICRQRSYLVKMSHKRFQERNLQPSSVSWLPLLFSSCACVCGRKFPLAAFAAVTVAYLQMLSCCSEGPALYHMQAGTVPASHPPPPAPSLHPRGEGSEDAYSLTRNSRSSCVCKAKILFNQTVSVDRYPNVGLKRLVPFNDREVAI